MEAGQRSEDQALMRELISQIAATRGVEIPEEEDEELAGQVIRRQRGRPRKEVSE
jgi:hypothetical protein